MFWLMSGDELEFGCPLLDSTWDQSQRGQQQPRCLVKSWFIWTLSCFGYLGSCFSLICLMISFLTPYRFQQLVAVQLEIFNDILYVATFKS